MDIKDDPTRIAQRLAEFQLEHRGLDEAIAKLAGDPDSEDLQIRRLKKRKLKLKDTIAVLESKLIPDLDA